MASRNGLPKVEISRELLEEIEAHAYSNLSAEVGGMLVGTTTDGATKIIGFIPARTASAEQISLTFTHEVWAEILGVAQERFPDQVLVGWYHTHPSFGLFLSQYDEFIQRNFFAERGQVALVIDPIAGTYAWFAERKNEIVKFGEGETRRGPQTPPTHSNASEKLRPNSNRIVLATGLASLLTALVVWGVMQVVSPSKEAAFRAAQSQAEQYMQQRDELLRVLADPVLQYTVVEGDSLAAILERFYGNTDTAAMLALNQLELDSSLTVGSVLLLPDVPNVTVSNKSSAQLVPTPIPSSNPTPTQMPISPQPTAPVSSETPAPTSTN